MRLFRQIKIHKNEFILKTMPWIPADLKKSLSVIIDYLRNASGLDISLIGLYGSWQRGDAGPESDVDIVLLLDSEVSWFSATEGLVNHSEASQDISHWKIIEKEANKHSTDSRFYSISVVTQSMIDYNLNRGPIHLQNWAHALMNCISLWEKPTVNY